MAKPWRKRWPYVSKKGRRSYVVGFYDHDHRERCRTFPSTHHAREWMDAYITAERRGGESLRRFLLDLDAKEANALEARTIGEVLELYLRLNAHPGNPGGLAPATYERYESLVGLHMLDKARRRGSERPRPPRAYAVALCRVPAVRFNKPQAPVAWREQMLREGVPKATQKHAWRVLSAAQLGRLIKSRGRDGFAWVLEVLSNGRLDEWGKTEHSTQRRTVIPTLLEEDLAQWREALDAVGHPTRPLDFIIPGDLAGRQHGARDPRSGASHFSENQARAWGQRFFTPAVEKVAEQPEFFAILGATPYSLRRGGISLRLRAEDPQTVASECGTSLRMLSDHYAYAIEDLRRNGPRPADVEWRAARTEQAQRQTPASSPGPSAISDPAHPRGKIRGWLDADRRRTRGA